MSGGEKKTKKKQKQRQHKVEGFLPSSWATTQKLLSSSILERTLFFARDEGEIISPTLLSRCVPAQQQEAANVLISRAANILIIDLKTGSGSPASQALPPSLSAPQ